MIEPQTANQNGTWASKGTMLDPSVFAEALGKEKKKEKQDDDDDATIFDALLPPLLAVGTVGLAVTISLLFGAVTWGSYFGDSSPDALARLKRGVDRLVWSFYLFCWGTAPIIEIGIIYAMAPIKNLVVRKKKHSMRRPDSPDVEVHRIEHGVVYVMLLMIIGAVTLQVVGAFMSVLAVGVLFPWGPLQGTIIYLLVTVAVTFVLLLTAAYYAVGNDPDVIHRMRYSLCYGLDEVNVDTVPSQKSESSTEKRRPE